MRGTRLLATALAAAALAAAAACSSNVVIRNNDDAGVDAPVATPDVGSPDGPSTGANSAPSLVFVNGLVNGNTGDAGAGLVLSDVRVCIRDAANQWIHDYALPDATPMPLTSYPGVQLGRGVDFGSMSTSNVVLEVYSAYALSGDAAWVSNRTDYRCDTMNCTSSGPPCQPHVTIQAMLGASVNVVALVDQKGGGVTLAATRFDDKTFAGSAGSLWGTVVDFSGWHAGSPIGAFYGNYVDGSGQTNFPIADPLTATTQSPKEITAAIAPPDYDGLGIRFDAQSGQQPFDRFGQSLDSVAFVSDATLTPPEFYGVRANFVFALVGDPNDPKSVQNDGGRDPSFDGRGLHIIAVPYATPLPATP